MLSVMGYRRESKKQEMRLRISDAATELFYERGFDAVTIEEIALAAQVSKMTVFNYFSRKEELLLDREDDLRLRPLSQAIRSRAPESCPIDAVMKAVVVMNREKHPLCHIGAYALPWWRVIAGSPALKARLRELADEAGDELACALSGHVAPTGSSRITGCAIATTMRIGREEAFKLLEAGVAARSVNAAFLTLVRQGLGVTSRTIA